MQLQSSWLAKLQMSQFFQPQNMQQQQMIQQQPGQQQHMLVNNQGQQMSQQNAQFKQVVIQQVLLTDF